MMSNSNNPLRTHSYLPYSSVKILSTNCVTFLKLFNLSTRFDINLFIYMALPMVIENYHSCLRKSGLDSLRNYCC